MSTSGILRQRPVPNPRPVRTSPVQNVRSSGNNSPVPRVPPGGNGSTNQTRNPALAVYPHTKHLQSRPAGDRSPMYSPSSPTASSTWSQSENGSDSGSQVDGHPPRDPSNRNNIPSAVHRHPPSPPCNVQYLPNG